MFSRYNLSKFCRLQKTTGKTRQLLSSLFFKIALMDTMRPHKAICSRPLLLLLVNFSLCVNLSPFPLLKLITCTTHNGHEEQFILFLFAVTFYHVFPQF